MYGVASRVRRDQEAAAMVLRFLLTTPDGTRATVEMRGDEIRGMLDDGDRVQVRAPSAFPDGILRPVSVRNHTTDSDVTTWRRPLHHRLGKPLIGALATAVISSLVTVAIGKLFPEPAARGIVPSPSDWLEENRGWLTLVAIGAVLAVAGFAFTYVRERRHGWKWPAAVVAGSVVVGVLIGLVINASNRY